MDTKQQIDAMLAERLRALRLLRGLSTKALAEAIGKKQHTITRIENGVRDLSASELVTLSRTLGVHVSVLIGEIPATPLTK